MKYSIVFATFGCLCAISLLSADELWLKPLLASCAIAGFGLALGYGPLGPRVFLKKPSGRLAWTSYLLFWPYHVLNALSLKLFRGMRWARTFDRIDENLYLGCRPGRADRAALAELGIAGVLDLTCEFSEPTFLRRMGAYRCIPLLDTTAPTVDQLADGAAWIQQQIVAAPVYVHCALGHGRSVLFVAAYLLLSGKSATAEDAVSRIQTIRPGIGLNRAQKAILSTFEQNLRCHGSEILPRRTSTRRVVTHPED